MSVHDAGLGHDERVGPIDAIADMFAPVVLISAGGIFVNGLLGADTASGKRLHELNSERLSILGGPGGEKLTEDHVSDIDRAKLEVINHQVPLVMARIRAIRNACVLVYLAMGLLVLGVIAIAATIPSSSRALGYLALALVVAGVTIQFAAIVLVTRVMIRSADSLTYETRRTDELRLLICDQRRQWQASASELAGPNSSSVRRAAVAQPSTAWSGARSSRGPAPTRRSSAVTGGPATLQAVALRTSFGCGGLWLTARLRDGPSSRPTFARFIAAGRSLPGHLHGKRR